MSTKLVRTPLQEVRQKLRVAWYRSPIDPGRLRELMQRSNWRGAFQALGHLLIWGCTGALTWLVFAQQAWLAFGVALFCHGTVGSFFKGLAVHELGHGTVFRTKWLNAFFLRVYSLLGWWNFHEYAMSHTYHHRYTLHPEGDREVVLPRDPTVRVLYFVQLFTVNIVGGVESNGVIPTLRRLLLTAFNRYDNEWLAALYADQPTERVKAIRWAWAVLLFNAGVIGISAATGLWQLAIVVSGHTFVANWLKFYVGLPMHCGLRDNVPDFRLCVRTIRLDPVSEFLYWHMNWHTEHHMYAGVPCYNLSSLYRELKADMPQPRTLAGAWREMRETWRRQHTDAGYQFETPLPRTAHPAVILAQQGTQGDVMATSIGDLAPEALNP